MDLKSKISIVNKQKLHKTHSRSTNSIIFDNQSINLHDLKELLFESLLQTILNDNS